MKKAPSFVLLLLIAALCMLFAGCEFPGVPSSYVSVTEHTENARSAHPDAYQAVSDDELRSAILSIIESGAESGEIRIPDSYSGEPVEDLNGIIYDVWKNDPLGSYAVDYITSDSIKTVGYTEASVHITYRRSLREISSIANVRGTLGLRNAVLQALESYSPYVVLRVSAYSVTDCIGLIADYCDANPGSIMEEPAVTAEIYPKEGDPGKTRIVEVRFDYTHGAAELRTRQEAVDSVISAGAEYVSFRESNAEKAELLYTYLAERFDYRAESSETPLYSLLCEGLLDNRTLAIAYSMLCDAAELDCVTVAGYLDGNPYYWNILTIDGESRHLDLMKDIREQLHSPRLLTDREMVSYSWDREAYPSCAEEDDSSTDAAPEDNTPPPPPAAPDSGNQPPQQETPAKPDTEQPEPGPDTPVPEKPGEESPSEPGEPEGTDTPNHPETPEVPENPGESDVPEVPEEPDTPEEPGLPEEPEDPGEPEVPEDPENGENPDTPPNPDDNPGIEEINL